MINTILGEEEVVVLVVLVVVVILNRLVTALEQVLGVLDGTPSPHRDEVGVREPGEVSPGLNGLCGIYGVDFSHNCNSSGAKW